MNIPVKVTVSSIPVEGGEEFNLGQFSNRNESDHRQLFGVGQSQRPNEAQR